jgi:hypothetical protein
MNERTRLALIAVFTHILLLPLLLSLIPFLPGLSNQLFILVQTLLIILFLAGYWEFFGMRLRLIYLILIEFLMFVLLYHQAKLGMTASPGKIAAAGFTLIEVFLLVKLVRIFIVILKTVRYSVEIAFPLKNGTFLITDGGNSKISRLMNYHYYSPVHRKRGTSNSMKHATDIVRLDPSRVTFFPDANEDYPVWGNNVYSPVSGTVIKVENGIDDNIPFSGNYPYNTGNTVVIRDGDLFMLIGHLRKGSIRVGTGEYIREGELIAEAGNSGYSERPHIHMQLIRSGEDNFWKGTAVPVTYRRRNLYKNRVIEVPYV